MRLDTTAADSVLDLSGTLNRLGGDQQLHRDIMGFFLEDAPPLMDELKRACAENDQATMRSAAHALKGLIIGCGGIRATQAAQRVENAAHVGDCDGIDDLLEELEREFIAMRQAVTAQLG